MDIIGKKFGRLTVLANDPVKCGYVVCKCECGGNAVVRATSLTKKNKPTRSCGCIQREVMSAIGRRTIAGNSEKRIAVNKAYDTNFQVIEQKNPPKNNKSGCKGVWFNPERGLYEAYISVHRKRYCLGRYERFEDAVAVRLNAEEEMFEPLIAAKRGEMAS
ncbi:MAG: hypothetical protein J6Y20_07720 [Lachnospiraceae bacterium]|nr:hypothetical protein [Lachnospiraceae bacterium]